MSNRHALLVLSNGRSRKVSLPKGVSIVSTRIIKKEREGRPRVELTNRQILVLRSLKVNEYIEIGEFIYSTLYTKVKEIGVQLKRKYHIDRKNRDGIMYVVRTK